MSTDNRERMLPTPARLNAEAEAVSAEDTNESAPAVGSTSPAANANQSASETDSGLTRSERVVDYCVDPEQLLTTYRLVGVAGICAMVMLVLAGTLLFVTLQKPRLVVVDRTGGGDRVVMMDDREFGLTGNIEFSPDRLTAGGKIYLVRNYLELLYGNNPDFRERQLEAAIKLMVAENGRKFFRYLKEKRILEQQAAESWQATWSPQAITIDPKDPFTVHAIGIQRLKRIVRGSPIEETHQLNVRVHVAKDPLGRDDRNLQTGYLVDLFDWNEVKNPDAPAATSPDQTAAPPGTGTTTAIRALTATN